MDITGGDSLRSSLFVCLPEQELLEKPKSGVRALRTVFWNKYAVIVQSNHF